MNRRTEAAAAVEDVSLELRFIDFDQLPEEEVQCIKNILNCPCSAVQLPFQVNFPPACHTRVSESYDHVQAENDSYDSDVQAQGESYAVREDQNEYHDEHEVEQQQPDNTVNYGVPIRQMVGAYQPHLQQAQMYQIPNSNFQHLLLMGEMINRPVDGISDGSMPPLKSGMDPAVVVSSNAFHPFTMYGCPMPPHQSAQYVLAPYAYAPQQPPPPAGVCKQPTVLAIPSSPVNFIGQHVQSPSSIRMSADVTPHPSPIKMTEAVTLMAVHDAVEDEDEDDARLEHVVVEVPPISNHHVSSNVPQQQQQPPPPPPPLEPVTVDDQRQHPFYDDGEDGFCFLCADQLVRTVNVDETPIAATADVIEKEEPSAVVEELSPVESLDATTRNTREDVVISDPVTEEEEEEKEARKDGDEEEEAEDEEEEEEEEEELADDDFQESVIPVPTPIPAPEQAKQPIQEAPSQVKSWASLFKSERSTTTTTAMQQQPQPNEPSGNSVAKNLSNPSPPQSHAQTAPQQQPAASIAIAVSQSPTSGGGGVVAVNAVREGASASKSSDNSLQGTAKKREAAKRRSTSKANGIAAEDRFGISHLGKLLSETALDHRHTGYMLRGLNNRGNWCYINSILQALLVCNPLYNILESLQVFCAFGDMKTSSPIINSMVEFVKEFAMTPQQKTPEGPWKQTNKRDDPSRLIGLPFEPTCVYDMLSHLKLNAFEGRQEDAEEFLSCLLNGLHDEMAKAMSNNGDSKGAANSENVGNENAASVANGSVESHPDNDSADEESWKVIEPRNKCSVTRSTSFSCSPLAEIFCGRIRSAVHSSSTSSAMLQPFFTLPLDVQSESVKTVANAVHGFVVKESLLDFRCTKTKQEVPASRQITLEELPPVLILHLKRFVYCKDGGCMKVSKRVDFDVDLCLKKEWLSPAVRTKISENQRSYKLVAVVYHCGSEAVKGHYVTDVYHQSGNVWFRTDDNRVVSVPQSKVLGHPLNFVPYLFFYQRLDTVQQQHQQQQKNPAANK